MDRHLPDEQLDRLMGRYLAERDTQIVATARSEADVVRIGHTHLTPATGHLTRLPIVRPGRHLVLLLVLIASLIVALAAGAALVGSRLTSPLPDPLRSLVMESVAPGVEHVTSDGLREILPPPFTSGFKAVQHVDIAAGPDGSVWVFEDDSFYRLGVEGDPPDRQFRRPARR